MGILKRGELSRELNNPRVVPIITQSVREILTPEERQQRIELMRERLSNNLNLFTGLPEKEN